jgi:ribulose 1,5-bisphosphate carboxylase large subunit-like protein
MTQLVLLATSGAEYGYTSEFWVDDIELPDPILSWFQGPRLGISGIRARLGVPARPLLGFIVKPRHSATLHAVSSACQDALEGGVDLLVDDLLMTDPDGELEFRSRVPALCALVQDFNQRLGPGASRAGYVANVGAGFPQAQEYIRIAKASGATGVLVDGFTMGFGNVKALIDETWADGHGIAFFATNMGSGVMGRNPDDEQPGTVLLKRSYLRTGLSELVTAKLSRLAGADGVHTGTTGSECYEVREYALTHPMLTRQDLGMEYSFPIAEGDLQLANLGENIRWVGNDIILETASGIANHPAGIKAGARAFRAVVGCLTGDMGEAHMDDAMNVLRSRVPEVEAALDGWKAARDDRIRRGWTPEKSWKALVDAGMATAELGKIYSRTRSWNPREVV